MAVKDYIRQRFFPHLWCPGCGHGIVMGSLIRAIEQLGYRKNDIVVISGIGCSSRMSGYLDFHTMHTIHGRALAFATGIKMSKPRLKVIVPMGDGDALSIGGNHFIHAARRNMDMTALILNNRIYGMTGGQYSPLTPMGKKSTTASLGTIDQAFDTVELARSAGASFVARSTTYHAQELISVIKDALSHTGFSVVEALSQCPTYYGRKNEFKDVSEMLTSFREGTVKIGSKKKKENPDLIERGIFIKDVRPEYSKQYSDYIEKCQVE